MLIYCKTGRMQIALDPNEKRKIPATAWILFFFPLNNDIAK